MRRGRCCSVCLCALKPAPPKRNLGASNRRIACADKVIVYYDRGQKEITRTLRTIFSSNLNNVDFRIVKPEDYRLFQVADLVCTLEMLDFKRANSMLNSSELTFFGGASRLKKNYLKVLYAKRM